MRDTIGKLSIQTRIATTFWYDILCIYTFGSPKLQVVYERSTYQTTVLLSEMAIFYIRAGCKIQMVGYGSEYASQCLSNKSFVRTRITWQVQVIYGLSAYRTTVLLSETFVVWFRVALEIGLESYGPRHSLVVLWYNIVCVYCRQAHTYIHPFLVCNYAC